MSAIDTNSSNVCRLCKEIILVTCLHAHNCVKFYDGIRKLNLSLHFFDLHKGEHQYDVAFLKRDFCGHTPWSIWMGYKIRLFLIQLHCSRMYVCVHLRGGGVIPLFCLNGSMPQNRVWILESWLLNRVYNNNIIIIISLFSVLNRVSSWNIEAFKRV